MTNTTSTYNLAAGRRLAMEFIEQLFWDGVAIEDVWALNDAGIAPFGDEGDVPCYTFSLREIDAARERVRRRA